MPAPVRVPEFDRASANPASIGGEKGLLDVNFCKNPTCGNFGLSWRLTKKQNRSYEVVQKYHTLTMTCLECGGSHDIYSNQAVDAMFLHVLKNTLLHEYCPIPECSNYRVNFYENYTSHYSKNALAHSTSIYRARCRGRIGDRACSSKLTVGTPWRQHRGRGSEYYQHINDYQFFMRMVCNNSSPSNLLEQLDCSAENYYSLIKNLSAACNFLSGRHFMKLQRQCNQHPDWEKGLRLYSDIAELPIFIGGKEKKTTDLRYLVTVTDFNDSYVVLAVTPMFVIDPQDKLHKHLRSGLGKYEALKLECYREHAHLQSSGVPLRSDTPLSKYDYPFPTVGLGGFFTAPIYAALGHFLVLRKMLSRIERVTHYVDNEDVLRIAPVAAFSDRIREGRCEVVAVKVSTGKGGKGTHDAEPSYEVNLRTMTETYKNNRQPRSQAEKLDSKGRSRLRKRALLNSVRDIEGYIQKAVENYKMSRPTLKENQRYPNERAYVCRQALARKSPSSSRDGNVLDLWIRDPLPPRHEIGRYFQWLTREVGGNSSLEHELAVCLFGEHQPVDTFLASLRQVMSTAQRPPHVPSRGNLSSYLSSARTPAPAIYELYLQRFYWNFMRRRRTSGPTEKRRISRAHYLGIHEKTVEDVKNAPNYRRQVFEWAEEISGWLNAKPQ